MNEEQKVELKLIHMEEVVSKEVSWLWYPYIPYGKITVIEGDPGEGKTTLVLKLAAMLSKGLSAKKKLGIVSGKGKQEDGTAFWTWIMPEKRV